MLGRGAGAPVGMSSAIGRPGSWIIHVPRAGLADLVGGRIGAVMSSATERQGSWIIHMPGAVVADLVWARIGAVMSSATRRPPRGLSARRLPGGRTQPHPGNRAPIRGSRTGSSGGQDPQGVQNWVPRDQSRVAAKSGTRRVSDSGGRSYPLEGGRSGISIFGRAISV